MSARQKKKRAPAANERAHATTRGATNSRSPESLQVLLEKFTEISIPDLWHYGAGISAQDGKPSIFLHDAKFGKEILEFWHLAHHLQDALLKAREGGRP